MLRKMHSSASNALRDRSDQLPVGDSVLAALLAVVVQFLLTGEPLFIGLGLFIAPIPLIVMAIGMLTGAVQALIFTLLTFSYISAFVTEHH